MASVTFDGVSISVDSTLLVTGIDLDIADGSVVAIVGPSGSGKSTLLRSIAGFGRIDDGALLIDGRDVTTPRSLDRDVSMVFQEPALLPRRTGRRNVEFPLEVRRATVEAMRERVDAEARAMHIEHLLEKTPGQMSRGEAQLVQMARALVRVPQVLLLDEPFASLDEHRRRVMRSDMRILLAGYGVTTVIATNDPEDALRLADVVVVLDRPVAGQPGRIVQIGTLAEVRDGPATIDAATCLGDLWSIPVTVRTETEGASLLGVDDTTFRYRSWNPTLAAHHGRRVQLGVRSESVIPSPNGAHRAVVRRVVPGSDRRLVLDVGGRLVMSTRVGDEAPGDEILVDLDRPFVFDEDGDRLA